MSAPVPDWWSRAGAADLGSDPQELHASSEDLSADASGGERVDEGFLLMHRRWASASLAPPVHLKSPHHANLFASMFFPV